MTKADPATRPRCVEGARSDSAIPAKLLALARQGTCQNVSMEQFGQLLPSIAGGADTRTPATCPDLWSLAFSTIQT